MTRPSNNNPASEKTKSPFVYWTYDTPEENGVALVIIDPQNDFIAEKGALRVEGAVDDAARLSRFIFENLFNIDQIYVSLDTHQRMHIAHPLFWQNDSGDHPSAFTQIKHQDILDGKWRPYNADLDGHVLKYTETVEHRGRGALTVWPEHCLVGTVGHAVYYTLRAALHKWEAERKRSVSYILKGNNEITENYSCFGAEMEIGNDPSTRMNTALVHEIAKYKHVLFAGQALSHCVNFSVRDFRDRLRDENAPQIYVLSDCCSPIRGYQSQTNEFKEYMQNENIHFSPSTLIVFGDED